MFRMSIWTVDFERFLRFICPGFPSCRGHGQTPFFFVPNRPKRSKFIGDETTTWQTGARVQLLKVFHDTSHEFIRIVGKSHINIRKSSILKLTTAWIAHKIKASLRGVVEQQSGSQCSQPQRTVICAGRNEMVMLDFLYFTTATSCANSFVNITVCSGCLNLVPVLQLCTWKLRMSN